MRRAAIGLALAAILAVIVFDFIQRRDERSASSDDVTMAGPDAEPGAPDDQMQAIDNNGYFGVSESMSRNHLQSYGCDTSDFEDPLGPLVDEAARTQFLSTLRQVLESSGDGEHVLVAALIGRMLKSNVVNENTRLAVSLHPKNPLILFWAADLCQRDQKATFCTDESYVSNRNLMLENNGAYWARTAAHRHRRGDIAGALQALQKASTVPDFDFFWAQSLQAVERGLSMAGDLNYARRVALAFGILAATPSEVHKIWLACETLAPNDAQWLDACARYGRRLETDAITMMNQSIGMSMQAMTLELSGQFDERDRVNRRKQELRDDIGISNDPVLGLLVLTDDRFAAGFIDEFGVNGEAAAFRLARAELERLKTDPDFDPCALIDGSDD